LRKNTIIDLTDAADTARELREDFPLGDETKTPVDPYQADTKLILQVLDVLFDGK
jgi:hypothetical protein